MKITKKVRQEVDFICTFFCHPKGYMPSEQEIKDYVASTVLGTKKDSGGGMAGSTSILFQGKRNLDITIKMWRQDLLDGLLSFGELEEDYGHHIYGSNLLRSIYKSIDFKKYQPGKGFPEIVGMNILFKK